jgi:twitching motility protein PilT
MEQGGTQYGMQTFDQSIMDLYKEGLISFEEAMNQATNPDDFDLRLRGITGTADRWDEKSDKDSEKPEASADSKDRLDSNPDFNKY